MADAEWTYRDLLWRDPDRVSGAVCFYGTRVPVKGLFDYIEGGDNLDVFIENFPSVKREQAVEVIELSRQGLIETPGAEA